MTIGATIGIVGGVVGILSAVIAYTRFAAQAPLEAKTTTIEADLRRAQERADQLAGELQAARSENVNLMQARGQGALLKSTIDADLLVGMNVVGATEGSVLVPAPPPDTGHFVFVSIHGPSAARVRKTKVPLGAGKAGKVFGSGVPENSFDLESDPEHFTGVDTKRRRQTETMLTLPILHDGRTLGVMQLLTKAGGERFSDEDLLAGQRMAQNTAAHVAAFVSDQANFDVLGLQPELEGTEATIMFCDLTASSSLFERMAVSNAVDCLNEFLERMSDIALNHGATVDKYIGDGVMLRFNVPRRIGGDHPAKAVAAAHEMCRDFAALKEGWRTFAVPVEPLFARVGIATGPVHEAVVGHPQYQQVTVFGDAVNRAANLCESAPRDHSAVLVDHEVSARIDASVSLREVTADDGHGKPVRALEVAAIV